MASRIKAVPPPTDAVGTVVVFPAAKRGRPTVLTPALLAEIEAAAEDGMKDPQIYALLGIARQTWSDWLNPEGEHFQAKLSDSIACARARLARRLLRLIPTMEKGWQAPVWLLTQHFPGEYARPNADTTVMVNAKADATITGRLTPEDLADLQERRKAALQRQGTDAP